MSLLEESNKSYTRHTEQE